MALVICRVLVTLRMRRRMSRTFAISQSLAVRRWSLAEPLLIADYRVLFRYRGPLRHERLLALFDHLAHLGFQSIVQNLLLHDGA